MIQTYLVFGFSQIILALKIMSYSNSNPSYLLQLWPQELVPHPGFAVLHDLDPKVHELARRIRHRVHHLLAALALLQEADLERHMGVYDKRSKASRYRYDQQEQSDQDGGNKKAKSRLTTLLTPT